jgi:hypothetical protein
MNRKNIIVIIALTLIFTRCYRTRLNDDPVAKYVYQYTVLKDSNTSNIDTIYLGDLNQTYSLTLYNDGIAKWRKGNDILLTIKETSKGTVAHDESSCLHEEFYRDFEDGYRIVFAGSTRNAYSFYVPWIDGQRRNDCSSYSAFYVMYFDEIIE